MYGVFQILKPNAFMNQLEMFKFACPWKGILWNPDSQVGILLRWWILNWLPSIPCFGHALELHHYLLWIISIVFIWKTEFAWKKKTKTLQSCDSPCDMSEYNSFLQSLPMYLFTTASHFFFFLVLMCWLMSWKLSAIVDCDEPM
jgi:hypothetical protein